MNNNINSVRKAIFAVVFLAAAGSLHAQTDCQTELGTTSGYTSLTNAATTSKQKEVDEWDGDVLKIRTTKPGVLTIEGVGTGSQNLIYGDASSGPYPMIDSAQLGTGLRELQAVVPAGDHCIQVAPPTGATGTFEVQVTFTDACHLGSVDDHGDSFLCATAVASSNGSASGQISGSLGTDDLDVFTFELSSAATVVVDSTGSIDVAASLFEADGDLVTSDDDSGAGDNFYISQYLPAGRYYVRVEGANGSYTVRVNP